MVPNAVAAPCGETSVSSLPTASPNFDASPTPTAIASSPRKSSSEPARTWSDTARIRRKSSGPTPRTNPPAD